MELVILFFNAIFYRTKPLRIPVIEFKDKYLGNWDTQKGHNNSNNNIGSYLGWFINCVSQIFIRGDTDQGMLSMIQLMTLFQSIWVTQLLRY